MSEPVRLSVALVTRNRPDSLERCLKSLRAQNVQPEEVVISDDSDDAFAPQVEALAGRYGCRCIKGPRRGLYANRNHAAAACGGTHVRTMDDDHEFPAGHFEIVMKRIRSSPESIWIIGEFGGGLPPRFPVPCPGEIHPRGFSKTPENPDDCYGMSDGAAVFPKEVLARHPMLEQFPMGVSYLEFGARLKALGRRLRQIPETYVIHHCVFGPAEPVRARNTDKSAFIAALLTYTTYLPDWKRAVECVFSFAARGIATAVFRRNNTLTIPDFFTCLGLARSLRRDFLANRV